MARLVLGAVGAGLGFMAGGPAGAAWGWSIGGMVGGLVDPQVIEQQGPRMSDTKMQFSSWGTMIPIVYGSMRMAGNVIDASEIRETSTTSSEGGKGGPEVETTTYSYDVDLAVGLCEGEIFGIRKIWAYGNLIYNVGEDADIQTLIASQENQKSFRVYTGSETQMPDPTLEAIHGAGNVPAHRGLAYVVFENFQLADYGNRVPNFEFEVVKSGTDSNVAKRVPAPFTTVDNLDWCSEEGGTIGVCYYLNKSSSRVGTLNTFPEGERHLFDHDLRYLGAQRIVYPAKPSGLTVSNSGHLHGVDSSGNAVYRIYDSGYTPNNGLYIGNVRVALANEIGGCDVKNGSVYVFHPDGGYRIFREGKLQSTIPPTPGISFGISLGFSHNPISIEPSLQYLWHAAIGSAKCYRIMPDGSLSQVYAATTPGASGGGSACAINGVCYVFGNSYTPKNTSAIYSRIAQIGGSMLQLSSIVSDICSRSSLSAIDVTQLSDQVHGYALTRPATGRQNIEPLQRAFFFDAVESDNVLKFVKRGGATKLSIPFDDLSAVENGVQHPDPIDVRRVQDVELPQRVTVNFPNKDSDYQVGSESAQRMVTPSSQQLTLELAIAMDANKAAQIADVLMYQAHMARTKFGFSTTRKYAAVEPTDVITVDGKTAQYLVRIVSKNEAGGLIRFEAENEGAATYTSNATGSSDIPPQEQITVPGPTRLELLDIPILRDVDDNAGLYAAMGALSNGWRGATLFRSPDDMAYAALDTVLNTATLGSCNTVLGNWTGANFFDETNMLTVTLTSGELVSRSRAEILNFENAMLVGSEIIQFRDAALIGEKQYRLSGLLRGRRGTEQHIGTHQAGERVVLLSMAGTLRPNEGPSAIGAQRYYKPVSIRNTLAQTVATSYANQAVGLKPYAPVRLRGGKQVNGDFLLQWTRRTRIDGGWRNSVNVPLGEASEQYEVDIMSGTTVKRTLTSSTPSVTYTAAQQSADFGAVQTTLSIRVYQISAVVGRGFQASKTY